MKAVLIAEKKDSSILLIKEAMQKKFEHVGFIHLSRVGLLTKKDKTKIIVGLINFEKYDCVYLKAEPELTQFIEPLIDELRQKGIYCNLKPESYYITSNKPLMYVLLNSHNIPVQKTVVISSPNLIESGIASFNYPVIIKTFNGIKKTQSLVIDSLRGLKSFIKSIKSEPSAIVLQEYLQGDVLYCAVIGEQVFAYKRKWFEEKFEHSVKETGIALSDSEKKQAIESVNACGLDLGVAKLIQGKTVNVSPLIEIEKFNKALGKELNSVISEHYFKKVKGD
jgi:glutathione synthase/RimK-type ligase-like ATP-grasp enzyme